ncbi:MAG: NHL repeat-containing protein, partial [Candidatus Kerfeldbacteria bacterium]|nr:NHL repeat-containing protein [Candidatus Kerfeldbacteria bacterium]
MSSGIALALAIGVVLSSSPAQAIGPIGLARFAGGGAGAGIPVTDIGSSIWRVVSEALKTVGDIAYKRALSTYLNNLAYNTAIKIATGGKGQQPLFETDLGKIAQEAGDAAVGDYLNKEVKKLWGRSLCEPITPAGKVRLQILAGVQKPAQPRPARCPLSRIINNVRSTNDQVLIEFQKSFDPSASDLGAVLILQSGKLQRTVEAEEARKLAKLIEGPFKSVVDNVSGKIKTPGALIGGTLESILPQSLQPQIQYTGSAIADAIGVFTKTLSSKWLERIFGKGGGFNPSADITGVSFSGTAGIINAREQFASLIVPDFGSTQAVDVLNQLQVDSVLDPAFAEAIRQQLSVRDAMQQGLLNGQKIFGYETSGAEPDFRSGYPYSSMKYLRKYRIIPVGWEIAAQYIREFETGTRTLAQIVNAYEDTTSPYYHLVDPNWTLTIPEHVCRRTGFTERIVKNSCRPVPLDSSDLFANPDPANTPPAFVYDDLNNDNLFDPEAQARELQESSKLVCTREERCVDEQSCIVTNPDGSCRDFGYCVEDRAIWRFNGTACDPQYVSCLAVSDPEGNSASYLQNTLDFNSCDASNAGCQWLCRDYDPRNDTFSCENTYAPTVPASASGALQYLGAVGVQGVSGVAVAADGTVYAVSQTQHVIYRLSANLSTANAIFGTTGLPGCTATTLTAPRGIDVDRATGDLIVADTGCARTMRINATTLQRTDFQAGVNANDVATDITGDVLVVAGTAITRYRSDLSTVLDTATTPAASENSGVAIDGSRNVYVVTGPTDYVRKFDPALNLVDAYVAAPPAGPSNDSELFTADPVGIAVDTVGQIYVTEQPIAGPGGNRVYILNPAMDQKLAVFGTWGVTGAGENAVNTPTAVAVSNEGAYVADRGNDRVIRLSSSQGTQCVRDDGDSCTVAPGDTSCTVECVLP